jgi:hypothetical protein|tara:strand:- start:8993 stop:9166 length:174 start_codon:yes stop_codon:yes gene_type:complete
MTTEAMTSRVKELKFQQSKTEDFAEQMEIADEIHNIQMKLNGVKPTDSYIDCVGCGS